MIMKFFCPSLLLFAVIFSSYGRAETKPDSTTEDKKEMRDLVIRLLKWHENNDVFEGFVPIYNETSRLAIGMDLKALQEALDNLTESNFFDKEFINNYSNIVTSIDKKIKNREIVFMDGDMPPYAGANPWCNCQDYPYENPWDKIDIDFISIDKSSAVLTWTWGDSDWSKYFKYKVRAKKKNGEWRISYLEGFDFNDLTK